MAPCHREQQRTRRPQSGHRAGAGLGAAARDAAVSELPGNVACVGAVAARSLELGVGTNDVHFSVTWKGLPAGSPDIVRHYASFWELAQQEADSRVYGGIHFRFDNEVSQEYCPKIADHAFATVAVPR